jgi:hypothetical protein
MVTGSGEQLHERSAIEPFRDAGECGFRVLLHARGTLVWRGAWSKPAERIGACGQEESKAARYN